MFFTFSHPQIRILARHGKKWARTNVISLSFHTLFFHFPFHKSNFRGITLKNGVGPPLFVCIFSYLLIQISKRFGKRWPWTPTEPANMPKIMTIKYQQFAKTNTFSLFPYTFFPIFAQDTSKSGFGDGQKWGKVGLDPPNPV